MQKTNKANIRLFVENELNIGQSVILNKDQMHYLFHVMKKAAGDFLCCLDNISGEYLCQIDAINKKECRISVCEKTRSYSQSPDIWLMFAPVKKDNTDFIIQKSTELGSRKLIPVSTQRSISEKIKKERFLSQAIEASEQCRRLDLPEVSDITPLPNILKNWDKTRVLFYMDETLIGKDAKTVFSDKSLQNKPAAILVGPEGGFSEEEFKLLRSLPYAIGVTLGSRILRAETAVVAALSCWQSMLGDWQNV